MALRITPMRPIERNGLKGFGLTVFIERATEIPAGSHNQRHELVAGPVDQQGKPLVTADTVASVSEPHPHSSADLLPSETDTAGEVPPPISPATPSIKSEDA